MASRAVRRIIDIGANLTDPMFRGVYNGSEKHMSDLTDVIRRAINNGIDKIIVTAGSLEDSQNALQLSRTEEMLYCTVGCHPTRCLEFDAYGDPDKYLNDLKKLIDDNRDKVVAVGECGLDYDRLQFCPKDQQLKYFERQLFLSEATGLPLFLHCRNSANDLLTILTNNRHKFTGGVVHSFDGTIDEAKQFMQLGLYIGINGCSLKTESNLKVVSELPIDRLMIETDCPWCEVKQSHASAKHVKTQFESRKKEKFEKGLHVKGRNEPSNCVQILEILSNIKNHSIDDLAQKSYTGNLLKKTGTLPVVEQAFTKIETYSMISYSWLATNVPIYWNAVSAVLSPYVNLFWLKFTEVMIYMWDALQPVRDWINKNIPPLLEKISDEYAPKVVAVMAQIGSQLHTYYNLVMAFIINNALVFSNWMQTNVLTGTLAPENIVKVLSQSVEVLQSYVADAYQWTSTQFKALTQQ